MSKFRSVLLGCLALSLTIVVPATNPASAQDVAAVDLTVMSFNIWVGGGEVDFDQVPAAIEAAGADIVGIQESSGNLRRIADGLGWDYIHGPQQIISRYPIIESSGASDYVYVEVTPGKVVAVSNVHLQPYPYGPYDFRDGASLAEVLANEQTHTNQMASRFSSLPALAEAGVPVFLTGDFNVPSHLDWTDETAAATPRPFDLEVPWPVSTRLDELRFRDSFREVHPDPVTKPGYTWTPGYPPPEMTDDEVHDRIDFVYAGGSSVTTGSWAVGEPPPGTGLPGDFGGPHADIVVDPWPSDHRAMVSSFEVTPTDQPGDEPGPAAEISTSRGTYRPGQPIEVEFSGAPGSQLDWVGVYGVDDTPNGSPPSYLWTYIDGDVEGSRTLNGSSEGTTWPLPAGEYALHLFANDGYQILATTYFTVS